MTAGRTVCRWFVAGLLALVLTPCPQLRAAPDPTPDPFAECEARFRAAPENREAARCFASVGRDARWQAEAVRRLEAHLARQGDNPWLHFSLANAEWAQRSPRVAAGYREAARLFAARGEVAYEIEARCNLITYLGLVERLAEAEEELAAALRLAAASGDPVLEAKVSIEQARLLLRTGRDLGHVYRTLLRFEDTVADDASSGLQRAWLSAIVDVSQALRLSRPAERYGRRLLELQDPYAAVFTRLNLAWLRLDDVPSGAAAPDAATAAATRERFASTLAAAEAVGHRSIAARCHLILGKLTPGEAGLQHLAQCVALARESEQDALVAHCLGAQATNRLTADPAAARALDEEARTLALASPDPWDVFYVWRERRSVPWTTQPRDVALDDAMATLDAAETLLDLQEVGTDRAQAMAVLTPAFSWVAGQLLSAAEPPSPADVRRAFAVTERSRGRVLLESLAATRRAPSPAAAPLLARLAELRRRKVEVQRRLLAPRLPPADRAAAVAASHALLLEETDLLHAAAELDPPTAALQLPDFASLDGVAANLAADEALLSYQLAPWRDLFGVPAGGSWLLVVTREGARVYPLGPLHRLVAALHQVRERDDLTGADAALALLDGELLAPALAELPPAVTRLILVPDGALHLLPFAALRPSAEAPLRLARYRVSAVPSATLWLRWRRTPPPPATVPALVLADPLLASPGSAPATAPPPEEASRGWDLAQGVRLGPLPYARREGQAVVEHLGGASRLLVGEEASERLLKETDLTGYAVLHLAAHAVVDPEVAERSAIFLAPGADAEDGWLQPGEIAELRLAGQLVVLSACESAGGEVLRGEGVMGVARAFFQAGARTVVASLGPLPDREAAALFDDFYRRLSRGASVASALAEAQRRQRADGAPAAVWALPIVLGDGDLVPFPAGSLACSFTAWPRWGVAAIVILAVVALATAAASGLRRRRAARR